MPLTCTNQRSRGPNPASTSDINPTTLKETTRIKSPAAPRWARWLLAQAEAQKVAHDYGDDDRKSALLVGQLRILRRLTTMI